MGLSTWLCLQEAFIIQIGGQTGLSSHVSLSPGAAGSHCAGNLALGDGLSRDSLLHTHTLFS